MSDRVVPAITGLGLITPLGDTPAATWNALLAGRCILNHARVPGLEPGDEPRVNVLACQAARQAIAQAEWTDEALRDAALVIGTSKGPIETWLAGTEPGHAGPDRGDTPRLCQLGAFGLAEVATATARSLGLGYGPRLTLSAACASGLAALARAAMLLQSGQCDRALVIAVESSLHPLFISSFQRLGVLPPEGVGCRPFDRDRAGFLLSEAAAAVCIERHSQSNGRAMALLDTWSIAGDATHLTGSDPAGRTLRHLLARAVPPGGVDLVHAHGTGTLINDPIELAAIDALAGNASTIVYSHKAALGHSLGASGLISVVLNCVMHAEHQIPPNIHTQSPLSTEQVRLAPADRAIAHPVHRSIALAAGFGGATAVVSLRSP